MDQAGRKMGVCLDEVNVELVSSLRKNLQVSTPNVKKMERGISKATENEYLVSIVRDKVEKDFGKDQVDSAPQIELPCQDYVSNYDPSSGLNISCSPDSSELTESNPSSSPTGFIETPIYTFTLPDLMRFREDFRSFLERDLIELSSLISLEQSGRLNWWAETGTCQRLWPLATSGDGNCLLHAASLGMWGFHDRLLTLRKALHSFLSSGETSSAIYRRWRLQCQIQNSQCGLKLSEAEWDDEWQTVLRLASTEPRSTSSSSSSSGYSSESSSRRRSRRSITSSAGGSETLYESLEEIHVLALAHILRRPIIVVADTILRDLNGEALAPIPFGGIYLPFECGPEVCHTNPLLLTYHTGHFSALVTMQSSWSETAVLPAVIPVTDSNHVLLPLHFSIDPGVHHLWGEEDIALENALALKPSDHLKLLNSYLDLVRVPLPEWLIDPAPEPSLSPSPPPPPTPLGHVNDRSHNICGHIVNVDQCDGQYHHKGPSKSTRQIQNVAKQFGSIGKKLKKNLGSISKLARNGSFGKNKGQEWRQRKGVVEYSMPNTRKIVSGCQPFILCAVILTTDNMLPYQDEMIENYLQEAKLRYENDKEQRELVRQEKVELAEKRQREIYLNGGFVNCINSSSGCQGQGSSDTSYLCKPCFSEQQEFRKKQYAKNDVNQQYVVKKIVGSSTFYQSYQHQPEYNHELSDTTSPLSSEKLRVKLPTTDGAGDECKPCRGGSCDFYGSHEFDYYCSKCFLKLKTDDTSPTTECLITRHNEATSR